MPADRRLVDDAYYLILWGEAETTITIMAASIPVLRVLIKEVRSRPGTAPSKFSPSAVPSLNIPMSRPRISWPVNRVSGGKAGIRTDSDSGRSDIQMGDIGWPQRSASSTPTTSGASSRTRRPLHGFVSHKRPFIGSIGSSRSRARLLNFGIRTWQGQRRLMYNDT